MATWLICETYTTHLGYMRDSCRLGSEKVKEEVSTYAMAEWSCFANVAKVNNAYPVGLNVIPPRTTLTACTTDGDDTEPTHDKLVERLDVVAIMAKEPTA